VPVLYSIFLEINGSEVIKLLIYYCDVFPVNTSNNLRVADFMLDLLVISSSRIYNYLLQSQSHCDHTENLHN
jgi:hypothetical protein